MKKFRYISLILVLCLVFTAAAPSAWAISDAPIVSATSVVLEDLNSGRLLYEKNMDERRAPASLTKIMTLLIATEYIERGEASLYDKIEAKDDCRSGMDSDSSTSDIYPGEIMSLEDLMYCAMLQSANEACNIIATGLAGSISSYVALMNERAKELGCTNTHFSNTNGLNDSEHYSTAADLAIITREASKHQLFMTMCNTINYETSPTNVSEPRTLSSTNALICDSSIYGDQYLFKGASGIKTGHTNAAGFCLISTATRDGVGLLCIVLGSEGDFSTGIYKNFEDSIALYKWGFNNFQYFILKTINDGITVVNVDLADGDGVASLHPEEDIRLLLPKDYDESQLEIKTMIYDSLLTAPIPAGTVLGDAEIIVNGESYGHYNLITNTNIALSRSQLLKRQIHNVTSSIWFKLGVALFVVIILAYLLLVVRYRKLRQKQLREKKLAEIRRRQEWERRYQENTADRVENREPTQRFTAEDTRMYREAYSARGASQPTQRSGGSHSALRTSDRAIRYEDVLEDYDVQDRTVVRPTRKSYDSEDL